MLILRAAKLALRKWYWLPLLATLKALAFFIWRDGTDNGAGMVEITITAAAASIAFTSIVAVPLAYNRLKREAAGLHISDG